MVFCLEFKSVLNFSIISSWFWKLTDWKQIFILPSSKAAPPVFVDPSALSVDGNPEKQKQIWLIDMKLESSVFVLFQRIAEICFSNVTGTGESGKWLYLLAGQNSKSGRFVLDKNIFWGGGGEKTKEMYSDKQELCF